MDKRQELQIRITRGQRNVNRLSELASKLPQGPKREELADKGIRMLRSLADLQDGFIDLYPGTCLYESGKDCNSRNKGTFHCVRCPSYLNAIYSPEGQGKLVDL
jgi:hypothetical protein